MEMKEHVYSVLVVSAAEKFNTGLLPLLPAASFEPVTLVCDISSAKREVLQRTYDFVIVNAPLPDDMGVRFSVDVSAGSDTIALPAAGWGR